MWCEGVHAICEDVCGVRVCMQSVRMYVVCEFNKNKVCVYKRITVMLQIYAWY